MRHEPSQVRRTAIALFLAGAVAGCHKKEGTAGGVSLAQVSDAFKAAGFKVDDFKPVDPASFSAQTCVAGVIDGVDTVVCEYGSADALVLGKKAGEAWAAGASTAAVLGNGRTLLAVVDRGRADPNGKTIHKITQAFSKTR